MRAPISGRISVPPRRPRHFGRGGNGGDATLLTTINAVDPIYFTFDVSEALLLKAQRERAAGAGAAQQVEIRLQDEPDYRWRGPGRLHRQWHRPQFGHDPRPRRRRQPRRLPHARACSAACGWPSRRPVNVLLVPDSAVLTDQAGKMVMTIGKNGQPMPVPVTVGPVIDGLA